MKNNSAFTLFFDLYSTTNRINKQLDRSLSTIHGIGITEFMVMRQLSMSTNNTLSRIELANNIGLSASGVTRLLNPMEKIGLVKKESNAKDARVSLVKLSSSGEGLFNDALKSFEIFITDVTNGLSKKQIGEASKLVNALN